MSFANHITQTSSTEHTQFEVDKLRVPWLRLWSSLMDMQTYAMLHSPDATSSTVFRFKNVGLLLPLRCHCRWITTKVNNCFSAISVHVTRSVCLCVYPRRAVNVILVIIPVSYLNFCSTVSSLIMKVLNLYKLTSRKMNTNKSWQKNFYDFLFYSYSPF